MWNVLSAVDVILCDDIQLVEFIIYRNVLYHVPISIISLINMLTQQVDPHSDEYTQACMLRSRSDKRLSDLVPLLSSQSTYNVFTFSLSKIWGAYGSRRFMWDQRAQYAWSVIDANY
jgi:hypothetical protein